MSWIKYIIHGTYKPKKQLARKIVAKSIILTALVFWIGVILGITNIFLALGAQIILGLSIPTFIYFLQHQ